MSAAVVMWALVLWAHVVLEVSAPEPLVLTMPSDPRTAPPPHRRSNPLGVSAVEGSCVFFPCSYDAADRHRPPSFWRFSRGGRWVRQGQTVASSLTSRPVALTYKDRTRLIGQVERGRCSMMLDPVRASDSGAYTFRLQSPSALTDHTISVHRTSLEVLSTPPTPDLSLSIVGKWVWASCSVRFFCEAHPPLISWSRKVDMFSQTRRQERLGAGRWRTISSIRFPLSAAIFNKVLSCTAIYRGGRRATNTGIIR